MFIGMDKYLVRGKGYFCLEVLSAVFVIRETESARVLCCKRENGRHEPPYKAISISHAAIGRGRFCQKADLAPGSKDRIRLFYPLNYFHHDGILISQTSEEFYETLN